MRTLFRSFSELCRVGDGASLRLKTSRMGEMVDATLPLASRAAKRLHWTALIVALLNAVGDSLLVGCGVAIRLLVWALQSVAWCWLLFCFHLALILLRSFLFGFSSPARPSFLRRPWFSHQKAKNKKHKEHHTRPTTTNGNTLYTQL